MRSTLKDHGVCVSTRHNSTNTEANLCHLQIHVNSSISGHNPKSSIKRRPRCARSICRKQVLLRMICDL